MTELPAPFVHPLARVEDDVEIGAGTSVWANAHLRRGARIGARCVIGSDVTVDLGVVIGDRCKVQNAALLYSGPWLPAMSKPTRSRSGCLLAQWVGCAPAALVSAVRA